MPDRTIKSARITALPVHILDSLPIVKVRFSPDEPEVDLFTYYSDEIAFSAHEFIGLTAAQAVRLKYERDCAFLRERG